MSATEYGIGIVKNRFALSGIEEEIDPLELLKRHELEKEARKKSKLLDKVTKTKDSAKLKSSKAGKDSVAKHNEVISHKDDVIIKNKPRDADFTKKHVTIVENFNKHYPADVPESQQFGDYFEEGDKSDLINTGAAFEGDSADRGRNNRRGLPRGVFVRGGGRGGHRGGFPRSTFDTRGKREYDRQSGSDKTGIKSIDKREGSGAHNWGNPRDDIDNLQTSFAAEEPWSSEKVEDEPPVECPEILNEEEDDNVETNVEEDEERRELTLDEWKALKTPRKTPTYNIRKAGEGEDLSQWKKMYALEKKKETDDDDYEEYELGEYPQRVGKQKMLEIDIHYKDSRSLGGGRGRGFGRGWGPPNQSGRGQFSPRQSASANNRTLIPAPKVDDERDFPSLA